MFIPASLYQVKEIEILNIFDRIKKRDFTGNSGQVIKNSFYQISEGIAYKIGSFLFTILLARLLMPELFGLYSLTLATILFFVSLSDLGTGTTLIKFISSSLGKNALQKAKTYYNYIFKIRFILVICSIIILLLIAKFLAEVYYQKPIFLALMIGAAYLLVANLISFFDSIGIFKKSGQFLW